jgi:hypothetical protein
MYAGARPSGRFNVDCPRSVEAGCSLRSLHDEFPLSVSIRVHPWFNAFFQ